MKTKIIALFLVAVFFSSFMLIATAEPSDLPESQLPSELPQSTVVTSKKPTVSQKPESEVNASEQTTSKPITSAPPVISRPTTSYYAYSSVIPITSYTQSNSVQEKPTNPNKYRWDENLSEALERVGDWLAINKSGDYTLFALGAVGKEIDTGTVTKYLNETERISSTIQDPAEFAKIILNMTFCGMDAQNVNSINYVDRLANLETSKLPADTAALILLAYDSGNYIVADTAINSRETLVQKIVALQRKDGSFAPTSLNRTEVDSTAMVLTALADYKTENGVSECLQKSLAYISREQNTDGTFGTVKFSDSTTISKVIVALTAQNMDINDSRFVEGTQNIVATLLDYQLEDGSFTNFKDGTADPIATEQAAIALVSLKNGVSGFKAGFETEDNDKPTPTNINKNLFLGTIIAIIAFFVLGIVSSVYFRFFKKKE